MPRPRNKRPTSSQSQPEEFEEVARNRVYYPSDVSEFMEVIQDPGQVDATDPQQKLTYPLLIEYCKGLYTLFDNHA